MKSWTAPHRNCGKSSIICCWLAWCPHASIWIELYILLKLCVAVSIRFASHRTFANFVILATSSPRCTAALLQKWLLRHRTESPQTFSHESNRARNGTQSRTAGPRLFKEFIHEIVRWLSVLYEWHLVRKVFYENLNKSCENFQLEKNWFF